ncbi:macrophage migration inhibitory factor, putative [Eimeria brunetti]|uniref:L-dopachrome isomerase n=1 Tax=Eimeria brunetti TaxID=51314 RepID=U6LFI9_9EIME|nr:macrophage migration inhibitory factor, putative [Eimeria brunetti]
MPLCRIITSANFEKAAADALLLDVETALSKVLGKPAQYINVSLTRGEMRHAGSSDPAASVCISSIGSISSRTNSTLCVEIATICEKRLGIPVDRVFFSFADYSAANIGIGTRVFG